MRAKLLLQESLFWLVLVLSVLDIIEVLPGDMNFLQKLLGWTLLGIVLYYASFTRIIFGKRDKRIDIFLILSLYFFAFKDLSHFVLNGEFFYFSFLKAFFRRFDMLSEIIFYTRSFLLLLIAVFSGIFLDYSEISLLGVIRKGKKEKSKIEAVKRIAVIYVILLFFSYFI